jgi:hypothetical protein
VAVPTSVTLQRSGQIRTPFGVFTYAHLPVRLYGQDVQMHANADETSYLMASPTQAVCDLVLLTRHLKVGSAKAMREFLLENMRMEPEDVAALDVSVIERCLQAGRKTRQLQALASCIRELACV